MVVINKFKEIKNRLDIINVAKYFGLDVKRAYKCICPFHKEDSASLSFSSSKQIFKCFGCGVAGDVITLCSKLLNISPLESAKHLNDTFHLGVDLNGNTSNYELNKYKRVYKSKGNFKEWENETFKLLCGYLHQLDPIEYMQQENIIEYYIDEIFINGKLNDKLWFKNQEEGWCNNIARRIRKH